MTPETICQQFAGMNYANDDFRAAAEAADWSDLWPEVDRDGDLTGRLVGNEEGFLNVDEFVMIAVAEAKAGGWSIDLDNGTASPPQPVDVELASSRETIRDNTGISEFTGLEHPAVEAACQAYHAAVCEALASDPRAKRLNVVSPKGQRLLHSQWCGTHWAYSCGAIGTMNRTLTDDEKAAISAADDAGVAAAKVEVDAEDAAAAAE